MIIKISTFILFILLLQFSQYHSQNLVINKQSANYNLKLFVKQHQIIPFSQQFYDVKLSSTICNYTTPQPTFNQISSLSFSQYDPNSNKLNSSQILMKRLRNYQIDNAEDIVVLPNFNKVSILKQGPSGIFTHLKQYQIQQRKPEGVFRPFRFGEDVYIIGQKFIFQCNKMGYKTFNYTYSAGSGLQISSNRSIIWNNRWIHEFGKSLTGDLILMKRVDIGYLQRMNNIRQILLVKCKKYKDLIYCIDFNNGLFLFDQNLNLKSKILKFGCKDFVVLNHNTSNNQTIIFDCQIQGQTYLMSYPQTHKPIIYQSYFHAFYSLKSHQNLFILSQNSKITFFDKYTKTIIKQFNFHSNIIHIWLLQQNNIDITILYVLLTDKIQKYYLNFTAPYLQCSSSSPITTTINIQMTSQDQKIYYTSINMQIIQVQNISHEVWLFSILISVILLLTIALLFIYYYQSIEQKLKQMYKDKNSRIKRLKKNRGNPFISKN